MATSPYPISRITATKPAPARRHRYDCRFKFHLVVSLAPFAVLVGQLICCRGEYNQGIYMSATGNTALKRQCQPMPPWRLRIAHAWFSAGYRTSKMLLAASFLTM